MIETIVTTSVLIVALVILRKLWKGRISFRLQYALWLLVAVRLLVPLPVMESALSIMNFMLPVVEQAEEFGARKIGASDKVYEEPLVSGMPEAPTEQIVPKGNIFRPANDSISETVIGSDTVTDSSDHQNPAEIQENLPVVETSPFTWSDMLTYVWYAGILVMALWFFGCNLVFRMKLHKNRTLTGSIGRVKLYETNAVTTPCLCGILFPVIYLTPESLADDSVTKHVIEHEMTHYRHMDPVWTLVRCICVIVYWFCPLVWLAAYLSVRDSELACDEGTLNRIGEEQRISYGETLIVMAAGAPRASDMLRCSTGIAGSPSEIKERIFMIARNHRMLKRTAAVVVCCVLLLTACTFGSAGNKEITPAGETDSETEESTESNPPEAGAFSMKPLATYSVDLTGDGIEESVEVSGYESGYSRSTRKLWKNGYAKVTVFKGEDPQGNPMQRLFARDYSTSPDNIEGLAVCNYYGRNCLVLYGNAAGDDTNTFWYELTGFTKDGSLEVVKEAAVSYNTILKADIPFQIPVAGEPELISGEIRRELSEVEEELDGMLGGKDSVILVKTSVNPDECFCYEKEEDKERKQTGYEAFAAAINYVGMDSIEEHLMRWSRETRNNLIAVTDRVREEWKEIEPEVLTMLEKNRELQSFYRNSLKQEQDYQELPNGNTYSAVTDPRYTGTQDIRDLIDGTTTGEAAKTWYRALLENEFYVDYEGKLWALLADYPDAAPVPSGKMLSYGKVSEDAWILTMETSDWTEQLFAEEVGIVKEDGKWKIAYLADDEEYVPLEQAGMKPYTTWRGEIDVRPSLGTIFPDVFDMTEGVSISVHEIKTGDGITAIQGRKHQLVWEETAYEQYGHVFLSKFFEAKKEWFAFGSMGAHAEDYFGQYDGYAAWREGDSLLQMQIYRNDEGQPTIDLIYLPNSLTSQEGVIDRIDNTKFGLRETTGGRYLWIFWDYPEFTPVPLNISRVEAGNRIRIWYLDTAYSFDSADIGKTCAIKAFEVLKSNTPPQARGI